MAISWRRRASVLRVLAAVYAELGEETFKGRYARIAKLYGEEATYDSIKSFFAKEVVTMAKDLKTRSLNGFHRQDQTAPTQRSSATLRFPSIIFDDSDNEIIITGERPLQLRQLSSQPDRAAPDDARLSEFFDDGFSFRRVPVPSRRANPTATGDLTSTIPEESRDAQRHEDFSRTSPRKRKRPNSAFQEGYDKPSSFGYVTNQGKHRCILCMTELASAELLRKHESMSKLHLANLKDQNILSRGCTMLAQVYSLPITTSCPQDHDDIEPLMSGALNERSESISEAPITNRNISQAPCNGTKGRLNLNGHIPTREVVQVEDDQVIDVDHLGQRTDTNADNHERCINPNQETNQVRPGAVETLPRGQTVPTDPYAVPSTQPQPKPDQDLPSTRPKQTTTLPNGVTSTDSVEDIKLIQIVTMLLSRGTESLAKEYIEEHPQLRMEFSKTMNKIPRDIGEGGSKTHDQARMV